MRRTKPITRDAARAEVAAHCQGLVDTGVARWRLIDGRRAILELETGDRFLFTDEGITRLHSADTRVSEGGDFANGPKLGGAMKLFLSHMSSPLGELLLVTDSAQTVYALDFEDHQSRLHRSLRDFYGETQLTLVPAPASVAHAIASYFAGNLSALDAIPIATLGSALQREVWVALRKSSPGTTLTYGKLAKDLGIVDPRAAIDVGAAVAANPIAIVIPCHRVIGSNGDLKGYAWGLHRKRRLLEHERAIPLRSEAGKTAMLPGF